MSTLMDTTSGAATLFCCDDERRRALRDSAVDLNGIDYLEVLDGALPDEDPLRQRTLLVTFVRPLAGGLPGAAQVRISGGERVRDPAVSWAVPATPLPSQLDAPAEAAVRALVAALPAPERVLVVRCAQAGDYSPYRLRLVHPGDGESVPSGLDPRLCELAFRFKAECPSELDCTTPLVCPEEPVAPPAIDYLARDYPALRRLLLDRLALLVPGWRERSAADLGVTLAELLAYVGDQLAYQQDAIATEAYLDTARLRTSLRRHALLVDYRVHEGANARTWIQLQVAADAVPLPRTGARFLTRLANRPARLAPGTRDAQEALSEWPVVFEPMHAALLYRAHNEIPLYTWGATRCWLPAGTTAATLVGHLPTLVPGDLLLFEEVKGPLSGAAEDADRAHRHVVRLTDVRCWAPEDATQPLADPLTNVAITEVRWAEADALPFPLCLSSVADDAHGRLPVAGVSVARGNLVLADHGLGVAEEEDLGQVPAAHLAYPAARDGDPCATRAPEVIPPRFAPALGRAALTFVGTVTRVVWRAGRRVVEQVPFDPEAPAAAALASVPREALPAIEVESQRGDEPPQRWTVRRDLLASGPDAAHFVVEVEHDGRARLRFGDGRYGRRPPSGARFRARYRTGQGRAGNVGADTIAHLISDDARITAVRNPLAASGGADPEDAASIRRRAPQAFRRQQRAVTAEDYAALAEDQPGVQRAAATLRWTGSWHTACVAVDRLGGGRLDEAFAARILADLERYRMAGHDVAVEEPLYVSLALDLQVCVAPGYLRAQVRAGLLDVLGSRRLPDGRLGLFHPDRLTFGQALYLSGVYAAARAVAGVASVQATRFERQGSPDGRFLAEGLMRFARLEIPRLDNDPSYPEHGVLRLDLYGGQ
ncbi:putative baseplate assembly protein [Thiococcus pfennigii]|uniref:putative baseplate assembly protein n=1 Tax=Thiococcus pfennigii TaxID=1057 RepID=UPI00190750EB|nr:putative baseplate assembly protein [Thiococcus pfennigii]MBK1733166.1 putative baseplate assembly protein [Thiococcus pfennigii]